MAKRANRVSVFVFHLDQLEKLQLMEPNATPERWKPASHLLVDIAIQALEIAGRLESTDRCKAQAMERLVGMVRDLPDLVPRRDNDDA